MNLPKYISPSALNNFIRCPFRWKCDKQHVPQIYIPDDKRQFGISGHNIYEGYFRKIKDFPDRDTIEESIEDAVVEYGSSFTDSRKKDTRRLRDYLYNFEVDRVKKKIRKPRIIEKPYTLRKWDHLPPIHGRPDFFLEDTGALIDWKFGANGEMTDDILVQGKFYEMLLIGEGYKVKTTEFRYPVLGIKNVIPIISEGWIQSKVQYMTDMINHNKFPSMENMLCNNWCPYILTCKYRNECGWLL